MQRKEIPKPKDYDEMEAMESKKERTIEEIFESVKVGTSMTLKEALGKPTGDRKNLTRLYAGLSSSSSSSSYLFVFVGFFKFFDGNDLSRFFVATF